MIKDTAQINIRSITAELPTILDSNEMGELIIRVHYQAVVKTFNEKGEMGWSIISDHHAVLNGRYTEDSLKKALNELENEVRQAIVDNNEQNTKSLTGE